MTSNCTRCGKARIIARTWKEQVGNAVLTRSEHICPDPDCQKLVQKNLDGEFEKRKNVEREKHQRELERLQLKKNTS